MNITTGQKGSITIELLIAFALLIIVVPAVTVVTAQSQTLVTDMQTNNEALYRAQAMLEEARAESREDFDSVVSKSTEVEYSGPLAFTKKLDVQDLDLFTKQATSTVTWQQGARTLSVQQSTILTDPNLILGGGGGSTCSVTLIGDWHNPKVFAEADVGTNNGGSDVDIFNKRAYVTADSTQADKHDFYVVDVSNPLVDPLPILGSIHTGPGLAAVAVAGRFAFVANISTVSQLQVIDLQNPSSPTPVASVRVTASDDDTGKGNSIAYSNGRVYLGLTKATTSPEFYVIDVTDPLNVATSSILASFETNTEVNDITIKENVAYLATRYATDGATPKQLRILDVSAADSGTITENTGYAPNPSTMSGLSLFMSQDGNTLYMGEGGANAASYPQFYALSVPNPGTFTTPPAHSKFFDTHPGTDISIRGLAVRQNLLFLWTNDPNRAFQIWDFNDNFAAEYGGINTSEVANGGFDCEGNYIYTASRSQKALKIIGPGPSAPSYLSHAIYDAATDLPVSAVAGGAAVYASVELTGSTGTPTGTVDFTVYTNKDNCTGPKSVQNDVPLSGGAADSSHYTTSNKSISYQIHYDGDSLYTTADSACMPLAVN